MADARALAGGVLAERPGWRARERARLSEARQRCWARTRGRGRRRRCALLLQTGRELRRRAPGAPCVGAPLAAAVILVAGIRLVPLARGRDVAARFGADRSTAARDRASARRRGWIGWGWRRGGRGRRICRAGCQQRPDYACPGQVSHAGLPIKNVTELAARPTACGTRAARASDRRCLPDPASTRSSCTRALAPPCGRRDPRSCRRSR
jgi:hypothetical protein